MQAISIEDDIVKDYLHLDLPHVGYHDCTQFFLHFRCLYETQVLPRIFFACTKYLQLEQLETPMGLLTRLVLGNHMFVEQFAQAVHDFKVCEHACKIVRTSLYHRTFH